MKKFQFFCLSALIFIFGICAAQKGGTCPSTGTYTNSRENLVGNQSTLINATEISSKCFDLCESDGDCDWDSKCCQNGCDRKCLTATIPGNFESYFYSFTIFLNLYKF